MLTYIALCITAYLAYRIARAPTSADAAGYLLVSGLIPLPLYMIGNSAQASVFSIDVCLFAYLVAHGRPAFAYVMQRRALFAGVGALFGFAFLAMCSGVFNYFLVDPTALKFYAFTIIKFWEYVLLAVVVSVSRPNAAQLRRICAIMLTGILVYEILHGLHLSGLVPLSGKAYYGPHAANVDQLREAPFSDRTGWFLTSYRGAVAGTASVSAWFSVMAFEAYQGKLKAFAAIAAALAVFSVFATSSRSDIAGLAASAVVFALCAPPRRWKVYACVAVAVAGLYAIWLTCFLPPQKETAEVNRIRVFWDPALRAESSYADRSHDRKSMLGYLPEHPKDLLIGVGPGNFHWYMDHHITYNFSGHNSYLQWTGELGIGGLILLLAWCLSILLYTMRKLRSRNRIVELAARVCLALVIGRMATAWGSESLFGTEGMSCYSLYFVGIAYFLVSVMSNTGEAGFRLRAPERLIADDEQEDIPASVV